MSDPDVIVVESEREEEITADHAELSMVIQGSSVVTGKAVLKQAKEVAEFVERLRHIGFPDNAVSVESISADVTQGLLTKSSAATYQLRVRCNDVALVATLLSELPNLKNTDLRGIEWRYPPFEDARVQWLRESVQVANRKAAALAEGLKVTLAGIHRCSEKVTEEERESRAYLSDFVAVGSGHGKTDQSRRVLVLPLRHTKKVKLRVVVEYRIDQNGVTENV